MAENNQNEEEKSVDKNDTGFNAAADFYSILNLPQTASMK